ncbi:MAG: hypothetical protein HQL84_09950 [Magnetococcales bacterium]|nr:hypothetical protein [Magnetococcales bacterium]MBF0150353.1 hypothetical protein [Magnetococcales bacterium]MBF0632147.1 hypothetical protein [Magnetococcales bacterium]
MMPNPETSTPPTPMMAAGAALRRLIDSVRRMRQEQEKPHDPTHDH